jgi:hypothetical protein
LLFIHAGGLARKLQQQVIGRAIGEVSDQMRDRIAQRGPQRSRAPQEIREAPFCLGEDRLVAEVAQNADEPRGQEFAIVGFPCRLLPAEPVEDRAQLRARISLKARPARLIALQIVEPGEHADDPIPDHARVDRIDSVKQREERRGRNPPGFDLGPAVSQEIDPVDDRHVSDRARQRRLGRRIVLHPVVADVAEIELERLVTGADINAGTPIQQCDLGGAQRAQRAERDWDLPVFGRRARFMDGEPVLPQRDVSPARFAGHLGNDQRYAGLLRERRRNRGHRLIGSRAERLPEIGGGGVAEGTRLHVAADAGGYKCR